MSKSYDCVIFDLDGTLLNTERMNMLPLQRLIKEVLNQNIPYEQLLQYMAYPGKKTLELLGFNQVEYHYKTWVRYVNEFEERASLYDRFSDVICELSENGVICGIASSKMKDQYIIDFHPTGLQQYMKSVILAEDTIHHKPHPEPLQKVARNLNVLTSRCLYVGDTLADYKSSQAAGMAFALAQWGARNTENIKPDYFLNHPRDLLNVLK